MTMVEYREIDMNNGKLSIDPCYGFGTEWVVTFKKKIRKRKQTKQINEKKKRYDYCCC